MTDYDDRFAFRTLLNDMDQGGPCDVEDAYQWCIDLAGSHYENFPVVSLFVPRALRRHVAAIYAFARVADDVADEPGMTVGERLQTLEKWRVCLRAAAEGVGSGYVFTALADTIRTFRMPIKPFEQLISAFELDVRNEGFSSMTGLLEYCSMSANPIGRLLLLLFGESRTETRQLSDSVCTGLQLANFWQDLSIDIPRGRHNIPRDVLRAYGVRTNEQGPIEHVASSRTMIRALVADARSFLMEGAPIVKLVGSGSLRRQLKAVVSGGLRICDMCDRLGEQLFVVRPSIHKVEALRLLLFPRIPSAQ